MDILPDALLLLDGDWKITYANRMARRVSRIEDKNLRRETLWELYPEIVGTDLERVYREVVATGAEQTVSSFYYDPFGVWFDLRILPFQEGVAVHYRDVTEQRAAQAERDAAAEQLQRVFDVTTDAVFSLDRDWRVTFLNRMAEQLLSATPDLLGKSLWESFPDAMYEGSPYVEHYHRAMDDRVASSFEAYYPEPLNWWLHITAHPTESGIIVFFRDITEQRKREDALRESEQRYRVLTELSPQSLWTANPEGLVMYANQRFLEYIGKEKTPKNGTEYVECFFEGDRQRVIDVWTHSVITGEEYIIDARLLRAADGAARWWHLRGLPLRDEEGRIQQWLGVANDVHDNYTAAVQLREQYAEIDKQRRESETIYRGSPIGMALYEPNELRLVRLNNRQAEILGLSMEEALGRTVEELLPGMTSSHQLLRRAAQGEAMLDQPAEGILPTRPTEYRYWNLNYSPICGEDGSVQAIAAATVEFTRQKLAEKALMQSEKLAAVGRLASSIAHEINNPLEAVTNLLFLCRESSDPAEMHGYLDSADEELRRVSNIVNQTLRFHKQASRPQAVSAAGLFSAVLSMYQSRLRNSRIAIEERKRAMKTVEIYEGDIRQVLNNLVGNAIDAMAEGGRLIVGSREGTDWRTGRRGIFLTVADTGSGMDAKTKARIFEAFFTTKGISGTGLGLWVSSEIVERHGGRLLIRSSQRKDQSGTVATVFLPFEGIKVTAAAGPGLG